MMLTLQIPQGSCVEMRAQSCGAEDGSNTVRYLRHDIPEENRAGDEHEGAQNLACPVKDGV